MTAPELLKYFARRWKEKNGRNYPISWRKEGAQLKRLLGSYAPEELKNYIDYFLADFRDDFARSCGFTVGCFVVKLAAVITAYEEHSAKTTTIEHPDWERIQRARERKE